ncbi:hypothetical protein [Nocardia sp. NPDC005998]|uniref:hypothetical protein n=1 Tax=Nocardia sp. NPDC005998 TaxID=3156894 RepID=UPI0033A06CD4
MGRERSGKRSDDVGRAIEHFGVGDSDIRVAHHHAQDRLHEHLTAPVHAAVGELARFVDDHVGSERGQHPWHVAHAQRVVQPAHDIRGLPTPAASWRYTAN